MNNIENFSSNESNTKNTKFVSEFMSLDNDSNLQSNQINKKTEKKKIDIMDSFNTNYRRDTTNIDSQDTESDVLSQIPESMRVNEIDHHSEDLTMNSNLGSFKDTKTEVQVIKIEPKENMHEIFLIRNEILNDFKLFKGIEHKYNLDIQDNKHMINTEIDKVHEYFCGDHQIYCPSAIDLYLSIIFYGIK